ncbi:MAG: hypothetical protein IJU92_07205 [Spirochaetaceae bacterium]|nr:hypothetical protein [Spirochaetaceae bacterium]
MKIKNDFTVMEMMIFFWDSVSEREKVSDEYFDSIAERPEMKVLYNDEFSKRSVSKVLSAISNRERLNDRTKLESRFWNNNMRLLEDPLMRQALISPIKQLSFEALEQKYALDGQLTCIFIPGHTDEYYKDGNTVYINFFNLFNDFENPEKVMMDGRPFMERISEIIELCIST